MAVYTQTRWRLEWPWHHPEMPWGFHTIDNSARPYHLHRESPKFPKHLQGKRFDLPKQTRPRDLPKSQRTPRLKPLHNPNPLASPSSNSKTSQYLLWRERLLIPWLPISKRLLNLNRHHLRTIGAMPLQLLPLLQHKLNQKWPLGNKRTHPAQLRLPDLRRLKSQPIPRFEHRIQCLTMKPPHKIQTSLPH